MFALSRNYSFVSTVLDMNAQNFSRDFCEIADIVGLEGAADLEPRGSHVADHEFLAVVTVEFHGRVSKCRMPEDEKASTPTQNIR